jgi:hypothetical protein
MVLLRVFPTSSKGIPAKMASLTTGIKSISLAEAVNWLDEGSLGAQKGEVALQTDFHSADLGDDRIWVMSPAPDSLWRTRSAKKFAVECDYRLHDQCSRLCGLRG